MTISTVYKLTDGNCRTYGRMQWGEGVTHKATGSGGLCTSGCIHAYLSPELAVLLQPLHVTWTNPRLFVAEMEITHRDGGLKVGGQQLTTLNEIPLPVISNRQRVIFAILCARKVIELNSASMNKTAMTQLLKWEKWAQGFIDGDDTAEAAARAAEAAAWAAARAAAEAAAEAAAWAAARAARAAWAAAEAAAWAAARAAEAAAWAAAEADFDLVEIAKEAIRLGA